MQYLRQCHKPVLACKQPRCIRRDIGPTLEIYVPSGLTIAMVPSLYKNNVHFERKLSRRRAQKCNTCARVKIEQTCTGLQTTTLHSAQYRDVNGKMLFFWAFYRHGTVFAPKQCAYQKDAMEKESPKI